MDLKIDVPKRVGNQGACPASRSQPGPSHGTPVSVSLIDLYDISIVPVLGYLVDVMSVRLFH